jgi:hypothetical protein
MVCNVNNVLGGPRILHMARGRLSWRKEPPTPSAWRYGRAGALPRRIEGVLISSPMVIVYRWRGDPRCSHSRATKVAKSRRGPLRAGQ